MAKILEWIVRHPVIASLILATGVCLSLLRISSIEIDSSAEGFMIEKDPDRDYYETVKDKFGSDSLTVVVIQPKVGDVFTEKALTAIETLSDQFSDIEGVTRVRSLTTVNKIKGEEGFINTDKLVEYVPSDPDELKAIREDAFRNPVFIGNIVSEDGRIAGINVFTEAPPGDKTFKKRLSERIDSLIAECSDDFRIYQIGRALTNVTLGTYIEKDQWTLIPGSIATLFLVLVVSFRSSVGVFLPILTGGLSVLTTLGFMAFMGIPVNIITVFVPSILIAVGCTEDVHMISKYFHALNEGRSKKEAVLYMATQSGLPIALTTLTTFVGFATVTTSRITILRQFGIVASFGLVANFFITIIAVPTFLQWFGSSRRLGKATDAGTTKSTRIESCMKWLSQATMSHRVVISVLSAAVTIFALIGCFRIRVNSDFISCFKPTSPIRQKISAIHRDLSGVVNFGIVVETGAEDMIKAPEVLKQIVGLQEHMDQLGAIDKSISLTDYIRTMNREMHEGDPGKWTIPDSDELVAQYLLLLGDDDLASYVDSNYSTARIAVRHNIADSGKLSRVVATLREYVDREFPKNLVARFTGEGILVNNGGDAMSIGQVQSLSLALVAIFIIISILFMSPKAGLLAMVPNGIPILFNLGVMGWLNIPLNVGTSMVAAVALGIAVDDTIHFMVRYQRELRATNDQRLAMSKTLLAEGQPIIFTSVSLALGFGVLMLSSTVPTMYFGLLAALVMVYAIIADLIITPVLLVSVQLITVWDFVLLKLSKDITKESPIFKDLTHSEAKKVVLLGALRPATAGAYIIRQGERGEEMYVIVSGKVRITIQREGRTRELAILQSGDILGEMAMLGEGVRTANAIAAEDCELLKIDFVSLDRVRRRFPRIAAKLFLNMSRVLSERLRDRNIAATVSSDRET